MSITIDDNESATATGAVPSAEGGWSTASQMLQDGLTYASWPFATEPTDWDYQAQIGSYQGTATVVRASEETLRVDYNLYNRMSFESADIDRQHGQSVDDIRHTVDHYDPVIQHFI